MMSLKNILTNGKDKENEDNKNQPDEEKLARTSNLQTAGRRTRRGDDGIRHLFDVAAKGASADHSGAKTALDETQQEQNEDASKASEFHDSMHK